MIDINGNCQRSYEAKISSEKARQRRIDQEKQERYPKVYKKKYDQYRSWGLSHEEAHKKATAFAKKFG